MLKFIILLMLYCLPASAYFQQDFSVFKLDELTIDYRNYEMLNANNRPLLIYPESAKEGLNLNTNIDILEYAYFDSIIESLTTGSQYRGIGLQMSFGLRLTDWLSVGWWHHSQHVLDSVDPYVQPYPVEDSVQFKITVYHARQGRPSVF